MGIVKKILNTLHPVLRPLSIWYTSRTRVYTFQNIVVKIYPGVFHPALFFSTKALLQYLREQSLQKMSLLELGAGSGLISIFCAKQGATVTASDINPTALRGIAENAKRNGADIKIVHSDLFENLNIADFDWIIINPPYYPQKAISEKDFAWYCGEDFEYFQKLFHALGQANLENKQIIMILSEDCDLQKIQQLAENNAIALPVIQTQRHAGELNYIFRIEKSGRI